MRFLFGLILGGVLTLIVATAFNVPTHTLVDKGKTSWDDFLLATGDALFEFPEDPAAVHDVIAEHLIETDSVDDLDAGSVDDLDIDMAAQPPAATALPLPPADEPRDLDSLLAGDDLPAGIEAQVIEPDVIESEAPEPSMANVAPVTELHALTEAVWVPFRSQMSAQGFAKRLTGKLDRPFTVNREGPGRYQVTFSYDDELERLAVLDQVQSVTGQEPR